MVQQLVTIDPMVLQDLIAGMWQPGQPSGYYGTPQGHYYSTIGPYAARYGYGTPVLPQVREQIKDPSVVRPDPSQLRLTSSELEEVKLKKRQNLKKP